MAPSASDVGATRRPSSGKAGVLFELERAGFPVPPFYCSPTDLPAAVTALGFPLAVRSAATGEDGVASSFAGQFRTFLNLRSLPDVQQAVQLCRESVHAESVAEYCRRSGIDAADLRMDVIVQRMIEPELAGVAFTVNPVSGAEEVVIEACEGLGDALLAGHRTPLAADHPLLTKYRPAIEQLARRIQRHFGAPQDIEFAVQEGVAYVLQARPITRITFDAGVGEWTNADYRDGGVSSGACTPIMASLYQYAFQPALVGYLREMKVLEHDFEASRIFFGRPYWNLGAVKRCLAKLPGFVERRFDEDLAIEVQYDGPGQQTPVTPFTVIRALPVILAIGRLLDGQEATNRAFLSGGFDVIDAKYDPLPSDVDASFRALVERDYLTTEVNYFRTIFCASLAKLDFTDAFPEADYRELVAALPEMRHLEPTRAIRQMAAAGNLVDVDQLMWRFRHHSRRELDLRAPRWDEDRAFVEELVGSYRGSAGDDPRPAYLAARQRALDALPWRRRRSFERKLDRLRRFVWLREEMRDLSTRLYYHIRRHMLEIARRRGLGDDVFFMTFQEILADDRGHIDRRREIFESYREFKAPNEIGARFPFRPVATAGGFVGIGASQGVVRGVARVARSVEEAARIEKGAILVCPFTDPGWTVVLDRVAGVVTETGGLLSHAAVICREYGIPAVLAIARATERIRDGQTIVIDGGRGSVELVD